MYIHNKIYYINTYCVATYQLIIVFNIISGQITDPPSGSLIADFEGAINSTIITCDFVNRIRDQTNTDWSVINFRGVSNIQTLSSNLEIFHFSGDPIPGSVPPQIFRTRLTVLNMSNDLDQVTILCGSNIFPTANFYFRIYRKSKLFYLSCSLLTYLMFIQAHPNYIKRFMYESRKGIQKLQLTFVKTPFLSLNQVSSIGARMDNHYRKMIIYLSPIPMSLSC